MQFTINDQFCLDDKPFTILSGAVHYFRIHPSQWRMTLENLKRLGFNTVETYIPWNGHEPHQGQFNFSGQYDLTAFLDLAQTLGLYVLLRPTPYICAEWEFGGLPAWLLNSTMRLRSSDPQFLAAVQDYYDQLLPRLVAQQVTHGGPVLMMQVENEYGSYGEDKAYLQAIAAMLRNGGIDVPLFTADGTWPEALDAGNMADAGVLTTGNFGSHAVDNFDALAAFHQAHQRQWPLMCMEYWDGWFNRWGEPVVRRDASDFAEDIDQLLKRGSVNLYMFRGGTNFGFMNGCSARGKRDLPQVTSYDYDAPLTEWGAPTDKYDALQQVVHDRFPEAVQAPPLMPETASYGPYLPDGQCQLLNSVSHISTSQTSLYPQTFEQLDNPYGYVLYRTTLKNYHHEQDLRVVDAGDRVQIFVNGQPLTTQLYEAIGTPLTLPGDLPGETITLDLLIENLGRVNYGYKLTADTQRKGIRTGVMVDHQFRTNWQQFGLPFTPEMAQQLPFSQPDQQAAGQPTFTRFAFDLSKPQNTFIDCRAYGKGCVLVNGVNIGRYWARGPIHSLYVPDGLLQAHNTVIVFDSEGAAVDELKLVDQPIIDEA